MKYLEQTEVNEVVADITDETTFYLLSRVGELPNKQQFLILSRVINAIAANHFRVSTDMLQASQDFIESRLRLRGVL